MTKDEKEMLECALQDIDYAVKHIKDILKKSATK